MKNQTTFQPDYEQLYHALNRRRGEELFLLKRIALNIAGLMHTFESTDRLVADCAEMQVEPLPVSLDQYIHTFLWKLDSRCQQKRYKDMWLTLKIMVQEGESFKTMTNIYARTAKEANTTPDRIERSVRSYRKAVKESNTTYYRDNLAIFNGSNASFCWNAVRILRQESPH
jgi:hypothetical protein